MTMTMTTKDQDRYMQAFNAIDDFVANGSDTALCYRQVIDSLLMCMTKKELDKWISDAKTMGLESLLSAAEKK
jgi:hypothetical protein